MGAQPSPDRLEAFPRFVNVGRERSRESQESDTLSLLMPAFNERRTIEQVIAALRCLELSCGASSRILPPLLDGRAGAVLVYAGSRDAPRGRSAIGSAT
jgi:hypothetical protein